MLSYISYDEGVKLAEEKGPAPILQNYNNRQNYVESNFLKRIFKEFGEDLKDKILKHGCRYTHATSWAPTGTMALSVGNNASNGIEPSFSHSYYRNIIKEGRSTKEQVEVVSYELLAYRAFMQNENIQPEDLPDYFVNANTIDPFDHIKIQAAVQKWTDSSISKTINVPTDYPYEKFKELYKFGIEKELKGVTTFRFNPKVHQGVLVNKKDLEETEYEFETEDGQKFVLKGNEKVKYKNEIHTASNLYESLKEKMFGKY